MANKGKNMETLADFIFLGSKITVNSDCSHKIKRCLLLAGKVMTKLGSILKNGDIVLPKKVLVVKSMFFPIVMYGCKSWTIKKSKHHRIDSFKLRSWRRLLRVPLIAMRSNQSILNKINAEYSLEGLMMKLQHVGHLMWRDDSLEKTLMLGKIEGSMRKGQQRMR